jgi:phosphohistidine phosphatase
MQLFLVQHGEAMTKDQDPSRPLTGEGRASVRRTAELASRLAIHVAEIRHSDKLRAVQTAKELERTLVAPAKQASGLGPNDDVSALRREVSWSNENLMIVGHMPFLGHLAASLLCQDESMPVILFQMAGIVRLDRLEGSRWSLRWILPPEVISID